jgi:hypothetical protein
VGKGLLGGLAEIPNVLGMAFQKKQVLEGQIKEKPGIEKSEEVVDKKHIFLI